MKRLIARILGEKGVRYAKGIQYKLTLLWLKVAYKCRFIGRLHYLFFSNDLDNEGRAVIAGRIKFIHNQAGADQSNYFLRRAIHRLEKGLIMEPRRNLFALDYIEDLALAYKNSIERGVNKNEVDWATDVLEEYFKSVGAHPAVDRARSIFESVNPPDIDRSLSRTPYSASNRPEASVSYESLERLAHLRRSVRWYDERPVPRELIDKALKIALQSPSACNRQPYSFLIYDDPAAISKVAQLPIGVTGFEHNFPVIIAVVGRLRAYSEPRDRHAIYVDGSMATMAFMYALETLGLSSCPINWPDIPEREEAARKLLGLASDERIVMFVSVGFARADGKIPFSEKLPLEQARKFNPPISLPKS